MIVGECNRDITERGDSSSTGPHTWKIFPLRSHQREEGVFFSTGPHTWKMFLLRSQLREQSVLAYNILHTWKRFLLLKYHKREGSIF